MDKMPSRINLNDICLEESEEVERDEDQESVVIAHRVNANNVLDHPKIQIKQEFVLPFVAIREIFKHKDNYGYLLTNGIVGMFSKSATTATTTSPSASNLLL